MNIVGCGMIARAFATAKDPVGDVTIFASGVSDSTLNDDAAFAKEAVLLESWLDKHPSNRLVYFSSCAVSQSCELDTPYLRHKRRMEQLVAQDSLGVVFRLPQVVGPGGNSKSLANFLHHCITTGQEFTVWEYAERNLIDVDHVVGIALAALSFDRLPSNLVSIASRKSKKMPEIVAAFERVLGTRAKCRLVPKGEPLNIDSALADSLASSKGWDLGGDYADKTIAKYYSP